MIQKLRIVSNGFKTATAFLIASLISKGISFITTPIFTRLMSSEEFGQVSLFTTWLTVLGIVAMFSLDKGVYNVGMLEHKDDRKEFSFSLLILSNVITLIFAIIMIISYPSIKDYIGIDSHLLMVMFAVFLTQPAYNLFIGRSKFEYRYKSVLVSAIALSVIPLLVSLICVMFSTGNKAYARIFGMEITCILIYSGFYFYHAVSNRFHVEISYWKKAFLFNLPLIPHYLSQFVLSGSDRIMISIIDGESATAYYSVAYSIGAAAILIWNAVDGALVPYMLKNCESKSYQKISNLCIPILALVAVGCTLVMLFAPEIIRILAPSEYYNAVYVVPPIIVGCFFQVHFSLYANIAYYYRKQSMVMVSSITAASLNILLNYVFIPRYGYVAAGYTTMLSYIVQAIMDYYAMYKGARHLVYDMRRIILISVGVIIVMLIVTQIYAYWYIRYSFIVLILLLAFINRNIIMRYVKQLLGVKE